MLRRDRDFVLLWSAETVSELGTQLSQVAFPLLVLALALASIPIALAAGNVPYALIVVAAALDGAGFVVSYIAERGVLRRIVAREQLPEAVARSESGEFAATIAGPPLGGLLFSVGRAIPFLADAVSYAASAAAKLLIRTDLRHAGESTGGGADGLRWIWREPFIRACALLFAAGNPLYTGLQLLIVLLAKRDGASSAEVGVMLGIVAAGGLVGGLLAPAIGRRLSARAVLVGETCVVALVLPVPLAAHSALLIGLVAAAAMLPTPVTDSIVVGYRVGLAPDELQGRVQAASTVISFSGGWAGPLLVGFLFHRAGASPTVLALCGWAALLALAAALVPALHRPPGYAGTAVSSST
jgi:predicted MFS family arabinose efflux permease